MPTGQDVADFLGRGDDTNLVALAGQHVQIISAMAQAYTRGRGFTGWSLAETFVLNRYRRMAR